MRKRVPKQPNWRWALFQAFVDSTHPEVTEPILQFKRYLLETFEDKKEILEETGLLRLVRHHKKNDPKVAKAIAMYKCEPIRRIANQLLIERCTPDIIQDVLYNKFKDNFDEEVILMYRDFFCDTETLNNYDFARFYETKGWNLDDVVPPVPAKWRSEYRIFESGGDVSIDKSDIVKHMMYRAFFRSEEVRKYGLHGDDLALKWQKRALDGVKMLADLNSGGEGKIPEEFEQEIFWPSETAEDVEDIEGYDPVDDSGESDKDPESYEHTFDL